MKLLLLDTCGVGGSLALADTEKAQPIVALAKMPGRSASEMLIAVVRKAMTQTGWTIKDLAAVVVVTGPGSFTGVRVGLSAAKGLSEAAGIPMIAVSRLAILAAAAGPKYTRVCALLDAGRGEFYCGGYAGDVQLQESLLSREDVLAAAKLAGTVVTCEESVAEALADRVLLKIVSEPTAADALPLAMKKLERELFDDPMTLDANYLRRTDAEIFAKPVIAHAS